MIINREVIPFPGVNMGQVQVGLNYFAQRRAAKERAAQEDGAKQDILETSTAQPEGIPDLMVGAGWLEQDPEDPHFITQDLINPDVNMERVEGMLKIFDARRAAKETGSHRAHNEEPPPGTPKPKQPEKSGTTTLTLYVFKR